MFAQGTSSLTRLTPDAVPVPRASGARAARVDSDAARALRADPGWMTLSERLRDPEGWRRIQRRRRSALPTRCGSISGRRGFRFTMRRRGRAVCVK